MKMKLKLQNQSINLDSEYLNALVIRHKGKIICEVVETGDGKVVPVVNGVVVNKTQS